MNERFTEIATEVFFDESTNGPGQKMYMFGELKMQKFAELIVGECISTLNEMHVWQSVNNQNYPSAWHDAVDAGIKNIKQHFGVEE